MSDIAITVENLGKLYRIGGQQARYKRFTETVMDTLAAPLHRLRNLGKPVPEAETLWALKDVSFEVKEGEVVGIIGRNGAGKSTLLKVLSQITEPTTGEVRLRGRVGSLLEVGTGFHPELTGRENVYLNGAILGMRRAEIERKFDEIVAFAEVDKFLDTPVKRYSSGMYVRLAFAVAAHLEPEILVVDEVLAVGDAQFQKKCLGKMGDVAKAGRTVLFVSHNMGAIRQLCSKSVWLDRGRVEDYGLTTSVISAYLRSSDNSSIHGSEVIFPENSQKEAQLRRVRLMDQFGNTAHKFDCDHPVSIELLLQIHKRVPGLYGYLEISKTDGPAVMVSDSFDPGTNPLDDLPIGLYSVRITIPPRTLGPGEYYVYLNFTSMSGGQFNVDSPGTVCIFSLDDFTSKRGNKRPGFFSTLLAWDIESES